MLATLNPPPPLGIHPFLLYKRKGADGDCSRISEKLIRLWFQWEPSSLASPPPWQYLRVTIKWLLIRKIAFSASPYTQRIVNVLLLAFLLLIALVHLHDFSGESYLKACPIVPPFAKSSWLRPSILFALNTLSYTLSTIWMTFFWLALMRPPFSGWARSW